MLPMGDPCTDTCIDGGALDRTRAPLIAKAAQPISESTHIVLGQASMTIGVQLQAQELRRLGARQDFCLARVKLEPPTGEIVVDPRPPAT
jgi:hypothetical protein